MIDPRHEAILVYNRARNALEDKTSQVLGYRADGHFVDVTFLSGTLGKTYRYSSAKVVILRNPTTSAVTPDDDVVVRGKSVPGITEILCFEGPAGKWWRVFCPSPSNAGFLTCPDAEFQFLKRSPHDLRARNILDYWRGVAGNLPQDDSLRRQYSTFSEIPGGSALELFLRAEHSQSSEAPPHPLQPFSSNLSQREALANGLSHRISVIDGPPGTGKTQTILNLVANIVSVPGKTVGIVSFNNSAVDNVRDKLAEHGYGHIVADLGRKEKRDKFFNNQDARNSNLDDWLATPQPEVPSAEQIASLDSRLHNLQETARQLAQGRQELEAYRLERRHFLRNKDSWDVPSLEGLPLLGASSDRILGFLAHTSSERPDEGPLRRFVRRLGLRMRYGRMGSLDFNDTGVALRLYSAYYDNKIAELEDNIARAGRLLAAGNYDGLAEDHRRASNHRLGGLLHQRYKAMRRRIYSDSNYSSNFRAFTADYPVILSTCHSLRRNVPDAELLDYLIVDEASQVDLLAAGLALSCARNLIVVGDLKQLQHIPDKAAVRNSQPTPSPNYDYQHHNILSSIIAEYGADLPRTMLREHYRCAPAIIDFCNKKFYDGQLIPYTSSDRVEQPLVVVRTSQGNHMREHGRGSRSNQREADVIAKEVLGRFGLGASHDEIGVVTPYRRQVDKIAQALLNNIQADTVHQFQGRQKDVIIMSTVLDESARGQSGISFVDDPNLVNVAVSRAAKRFVLVTNNHMMPNSRHIRDLVHFIRYANPDDGVYDSTVLSVFDLLYKEYSALLQPLADRLRGDSEYASENIIETLLTGMLREEPFNDLAVVRQVLLMSLLPDLDKLTPEQTSFVNRRGSFDFVVYNRITRKPILAVEVDGFAFHENDPTQQARDAHKDAMCRAYGLGLLRLPTTGSGEESRLRQALSDALQS